MPFRVSTNTMPDKHKFCKLCRYYYHQEKQKRVGFPCLYLLAVYNSFSKKASAENPTRKKVDVLIDEPAPFHCIHFTLSICQVMLDIGANVVLFIVLLPVPGVNIATAWSINSAKMVQLMVVIRGAKAHHDGWSNFLVAREALWMFPANFSILMQCNKSCFLESSWNASNQARDFPWGDWKVQSLLGTGHEFLEKREIFTDLQQRNRKRHPRQEYSCLVDILRRQIFQKETWSPQYERFKMMFSLDSDDLPLGSLHWYLISFLEISMLSWWPSILNFSTVPAKKRKCGSWRVNLTLPLK